MANAGGFALFLRVEMAIAIPLRTSQTSLDG
ncbi:hypothetical protein J3R74_002215 [Puniceicoccus vermicola]